MKLVSVDDRGGINVGRLILLDIDGGGGENGASSYKCFILVLANVNSFLFLLKFQFS